MGNQRGKGKQFGKGNPGKPKGAISKKTKQWEVFSAYCLEGGLQKFQEELNKLSGKAYVDSFTALLEFHKPKLGRTEHAGSLELKHDISDTTKFVLKTKA